MGDLDELATPEDRYAILRAHTLTAFDFFHSKSLRQPRAMSDRTFRTLPRPNFMGALMKRIESVVLGTSVALTIVGAAQAADLPLKAKAVEYVKVCSLYGAGFWYIPGTDTCIRIGGFMRVSTTINGGTHGQPFFSGDGGQGNRFHDEFTSRSRFDLAVDTRTATEYGVVRTFSNVDFQFNNFGTSNPAASVFSVSLPAGLSGSSLDNDGGGHAYPNYAFIQFAGFTFGKSSSAYATPWEGYPGNNTTFLLGGHDSVTGVPNIQYTADFGNGVTGSIGLDDPSVYNRTSLWNLSLGISSTGGGTWSYGATQAPDVVVRGRIDQSWGLFQLSGALHEVNASYNVLGAGGAPTALSVISGHPDTKWGGAVMAALQIRHLPTGQDDDIKVDATYAKGDTKNVISGTGTSPSFVMFGGSSVGYQSAGFGAVSDGLYLPGARGTGGIILTNSWGVRGAFNHNWDPFWSTSLWGSYSAVRYQGSANDNLTPIGTTSAMGAFCAAFAASHPGQTMTPGGSGTYSCNPDYNALQLGIITRWTPINNLTFSGELGLFHLNQKMSGSSVFTPTAPQPTALYQFKDQNTVALELRVQRNF
jgi:hypothetical protein